MPTHESHAADRLLAAIDRCGSPVCVGIDPVIQRVPTALRAQGPVEAIRAFTLGVLDAVANAGVVPCVKFQSACYERYRAEGVRVLDEMIGEAKQRGLEVILDAKRGDIGVTAEHYAQAAFGPEAGSEERSEENADRAADWLTINSYLGPDAIEPFLRRGRGCFALVRTSNPGSDALQTRRLESGETVGETVARMVATLGEKHLGTRGFSALGAVVGATNPQDAAQLRRLMPQQIFLVPGYGAQGGSADDVLPCFLRGDDGHRTGAIVTASRSVVYAFEAVEGRWQRSVADAAARLAEEIRSAIDR